MLVPLVNRNYVILELKKMFKSVSQEKLMENPSRNSNSCILKTKRPMVEKKNQIKQILNKNWKKLLKSSFQINLLLTNPRSLWKNNYSQKNFHQLAQSSYLNQKE